MILLCRKYHEQPWFIGATTVLRETQRHQYVFVLDGCRLTLVCYVSNYMSIFPLFKRRLLDTVATLSRDKGRSGKETQRLHTILRGAKFCSLLETQ